MTHDEKITWMDAWAAKNGVQLVLEGECGFGRECVGISASGKYLDYEWYDDDYERTDPNGEVWTPKDAYHKHTCVAVLGRGESAESQLYDWLKWFEENGFAVEKGDLPKPKDQQEAIQQMFTGAQYARMVRMVAVPA